MAEIEKLKLSPAYRVVSAELERLILQGALKAGECLPGEVELASKFGVNRSTVREGIRHLEAEGLVKRSSRKKLLVSIPSHLDTAPRSKRALVMNEVTFGELWEVARALEPLAAELAAERATESDLAALRDNCRRTAACIRDNVSSGKVDLEFHDLVVQCAKNGALALAHAPVGQLLLPSFEAIIPKLDQATERNLAAHTKIVELIESRDGEGAHRWMAKHIDDLRRGWLLAGLQMGDRIAPSNHLASDR
jgi:GntR family transcriptional regulator, transcriptional repressor for pyruvate dehydrogenase complex